MGKTNCGKCLQMGDYVANALQWSCKLLIRLLTEQQAVGHHISYHASKSVLSKDATGQCNEAEGVISRNVCCCDILPLIISVCHCD